MTVHVDVGRGAGDARALDRTILVHIGGVLREAYPETALLELPDSLRALLERWPRTGIRSAAQRARFEREVLAAMPALKAFAMTLCANVDQADDLVQEAVCRGLTYAHRFEPGTNTQAWLFTILRNVFFSAHRRRRREVDDPDGIHASRVAVAPEQLARADVNDFLLAFRALTRDQREALTLVGAQGFSYEEAAEVAGVALGTMKSRVNRARSRLAEILKLGEDDPDQLMRAAVGAADTSGVLS